LARDESPLQSDSENPVEGASLVSVLGGAGEDESLLMPGEIMIDTTTNAAIRQREPEGGLIEEKKFELTSIHQGKTRD